MHTSRISWVLLLLFPLLAGCSHTMSYREVEKEVRYPDSEQVTRELVLKHSQATNGWLQLSASESTITSWRTYQETRGERRYNSYSITRDILMRPILLAFGVGLGGMIFWDPWTAKNPPDRNGDGEYGIGEYLWDMQAWFNPLSAIPFGAGDSRESILVRTTKDQGEDRRQEVRKSKTLKSTKLTVALRTASTRRTQSTRTDFRGQARINLVPHLMALAGEEVHLSVTAATGSGEIRADLRPLSALAACEILRAHPRRGELQRLPPARRELVRQTYLSALADLQNRTSPGDPIKLAEAASQALPEDEAVRARVRPIYLRELRRRWQGQGDRGLAFSRRVLERFPQDAEVRAEVARTLAERVTALARQGDVKTALALAGDGRRALPKATDLLRLERDLHLRLVRELWEKSELDQALEQGATLAVRYKTDAKVRDAVAGYFHQRVLDLRAGSEFARALTLARQGQRLFPGDTRWTTLVLGMRREWIVQLAESGDWTRTLREGESLLRERAKDEDLQKLVGDLFYGRFQKLAAAGDLAAATAIGKRLRRLFPDRTAWREETAQVQMRHAESLWTSAQHDKALTEAVALLDFEDETRRGRIADMHRERIKQLRQRGDLDGALELATRARSLFRGQASWAPLVLTLQEEQVQFFREQGDWKAALTAAGRVARGARGKPVRTRMAQLFRQRMLELRAAGEFERALAVGQQMRTTFPELRDDREDIAALHLECIEDLWRREEWSRALREGERLLGADRVNRGAPARRDRVSALFARRVEALAQEGKPEEAWNLTRRGSSLFPEAAAAWADRGAKVGARWIEAIWESGKPAAAVAKGVELLRQDPRAAVLQQKVADVFERRLRALTAAGDHAELVALSGTVLPLLPAREDLRKRTRDVYVTWVRGLVQQGEVRKAMPALVTGMTLFPEEKWMSERVRAHVADRKGVVALSDAVDAGLVEARVVGSGIRSVRVSLTRSVPFGFQVAVPPGPFFVCRGKAQNMVGTERQVLDLRTRKKGTLSMPAACANRTRAIPGSGSSFTVRAAPFSADLAKLAPFLPGKSFAVKQAAVWIVTDNATRSHLARLVRRRAGVHFGGTPLIGDRDVLAAAALLRQAGIDLNGKRIQAWLDRQEKSRHRPERQADPSLARPAREEQEEVART